MTERFLYESQTCLNCICTNPIRTWELTFIWYSKDTFFLNLILFKNEKKVNYISSISAVHHKSKQRKLSTWPSTAAFWAYVSILIRSVWIKKKHIWEMHDSMFCFVLTFHKIIVHDRQNFSLVQICCGSPLSTYSSFANHKQQSCDSGLWIKLGWLRPDQNWY